MTPIVHRLDQFDDLLPPETYTPAVFLLLFERNQNVRRSLFVSVALHRLYRLLRNEQALQLRDGRLQLDPGFCWVDAFSFEELLGRTASWQVAAGSRPVPQGS